MAAISTGTSQLINRAMLAVLAAYALTTVHHIYGGLVDGAPDRLLVPVIMLFPLLIMLWSLHVYRAPAAA